VRVSVVRREFTSLVGLKTNLGGQSVFYSEVCMRTRCFFFSECEIWEGLVIMTIDPWARLDGAPA